jgi:hypothetical protein
LLSPRGDGHKHDKRQKAAKAQGHGHVRAGPRVI